MEVWHIEFLINSLGNDCSVKSSSEILLKVFSNPSLLSTDSYSKSSIKEAKNKNPQI